MIEENIRLKNRESSSRGWSEQTNSQSLLEIKSFTVLPCVSLNVMNL
jgi:hypothetical protein